MKLITLVKSRYEINRMPRSDELTNKSFFCLLSSVKKVFRRFQFSLLITKDHSNSPFTSFVCFLFPAESERKNSVWKIRYSVMTESQEKPHNLEMFTSVKKIIGKQKKEQETFMVFLM